jgi:DNA/RNA endonuclease YhcR with UshA esterase domain
LACQTKATSDIQNHMNKCLILGVALLLFAGAARAQETKTNHSNLVVSVKSSEAKEYVGSQAVVKGTIAEVSKTEKIVRLNFDMPYPKQTFTAIIFSDKTNLFPEMETLKGKPVEVRGKIVEYKDRPQIVVTSTNQLKIVEAQEKTTNAKSN